MFIKEDWTALKLNPKLMENLRENTSLDWNLLMKQLVIEYIHNSWWDTYGWRCESWTPVPSSRGLVKQYNQELYISSKKDKITTYAFTQTGQDVAQIIFSLCTFTRLIILKYKKFTSWCLWSKTIGRDFSSYNPVYHQIRQLHYFPILILSNSFTIWL